MTADTITVRAPRRPKRDEDELTVTVGGVEYSGWQEVRVTRGVERMPSDFEVLATERYPGQLADVVVTPGEACVVELGNNRVITGYIDQYAPSLSAGSHQVLISGRGKAQDLVDCSAVLSGMAIGGGDAGAEELITPLVAPFGITVDAEGTLPKSGGVPQFSVNLGETPWDIIDRISRWSQVLCIETPWGDLRLAQVGTKRMASGVAEGCNVQTASCTFSMADRYSVYSAYVMSVDQFSQIGPQAPVAQVTDRTVPRFRPKIIISEQTQNGQNIASMRLNWELARRIGRSQAVRVTVDSWRDSAGKLWTPNHLCSVDLPTLKISHEDWVIGEVSFLKGTEGRTADLLLMPPAAYTPEPNVLQAYNWQVANALPGAASGNGP